MQNQQAIELFHLLFLRQLGEVIDKKFFVLKGGCNLRFFMKSLRYSEDIDLDVKTISVETLRKNVRKTFQNRSFLHILQTRQIHLQSVSEPKQTDTTQRWKIQLQIEGRDIPLPTKIEFSRRKQMDGILYEAIDSEIIHQHRLYPVLVQHYSKETAFAQKVDALCNRSSVQVRDLFDLDLLLGQNLQKTFFKFPKETLGKALKNIQQLRPEDFQSHVVAYLDPKYADYYSTTHAWEKLKTNVATALEKMNDEIN